ncbi:response regulator transcription factor [Effusibacillus consociatus]|uniref:Response regulator transcription factor n=1 Tax=Effusibacillus consociatus TaxID=1117041 RepID=A0ABV9PZR2_9BACL
MNTKILSVDDDPAILRLLEMVLKNAGYEVYSTTSGEMVPSLIQTIQPSLIILDIELPDSNGIDLVQIIRQYTQAPIMMLSGKNSDIEKISSFHSGADDYVVKPFSVAELVARVQAILRRLGNPVSQQENAPVPVKERNIVIQLESDQHRVFIGSQELFLTQKEFHLLQLLLDEKGKVLSRELILDKIWGINNVEIETRAVDACISRLRKKVKSVLGHDVIEAVPGFGYRLTI